MIELLFLLHRTTRQGVLLVVSTIYNGDNLPPEHTYVLLNVEMHAVKVITLYWNLCS